MLDTGADTSIVSVDLVPDNAKIIGTILVKGLGGKYTPCPMQKRAVSLNAIVMPREVVGRDM